MLDFINYEEMSNLISMCYTAVEQCKDAEKKNELMKPVLVLNRAYVAMQEDRSNGKDPRLTVTTQRLADTGRDVAAQMLGQAKSRKKTKSSRENGKLGGRPRKTSKQTAV